jgi:hypothetical protein
MQLDTSWATMRTTHTVLRQWTRLGTAERATAKNIGLLSTAGWNKLAVQRPAAERGYSVYNLWKRAAMGEREWWSSEKGLLLARKRSHVDIWGPERMVVHGTCRVDKNQHRSDGLLKSCSLAGDSQRKSLTCSGLYLECNNLALIGLPE